VPFEADSTMPKRTELESRLCPMCQYTTLIVHVDKYWDKWVICSQSNCEFEAFLESGDKS
jgi:hypothetical protein